MDDYDGRQIVGIDLHRRRSAIVRMTETGEHLETVRIDNDPVALGGPAREVCSVECQTVERIASSTNNARAGKKTAEARRRIVKTLA